MREPGGFSAVYASEPEWKRFGKEADFAKWKWKPLKVPPRPELIRERYADFFRKQTDFLEHYKALYLAAMNRRFGTPDNPRQQK